MSKPEASARMSEQPPTDPHATLARAAALGDLAAARKLLDALAPSLVRVVRAVMGAAHPDADDAVQESLIALVRALPAFRGDCPAAGYAMRIAVRTAVAARQRTRTRGAPLVELDAATSAADPAPSPVEATASARRQELLRLLLDELPEAQSETMALRVVLGCSLEEVAAATGAPVNTVRSRMRLAREALRRRIESDPSLFAALELSA